MNKCHKENCEECLSKDDLLIREHIILIEEWCNCDEWALYPEEYCDNCRKDSP